MNGKVIFSVGLLILLHSAYSAVQYRSLLRDFGRDFTGLPLDILLECFLAIMVCSWGVLNLSGSFKPIKATIATTQRTFDMTNHRQDFAIFQHRGRHFE
jgi:hypothetical protein